MRIKVRIDRNAILNQLEELGKEKQGPFILSRTLNLLAKEVQQNLRSDMTYSLKLNRKPWILQQVKIDKGSWATKARLRVTIYLTSDADFLSGMEEGQEHLPINGKKFLAFPSTRVFGSKPLSKDSPLRIKNLAFHTTPHGTQGLERTFMVNDKATGTPLILQRTAKAGKGRKKGTDKATGVRLLYTLIRHSNRPKKIHWRDTATNTVREQFSTISADVMRQALQDSKRS